MSSKASHMKDVTECTNDMCTVDAIKEKHVTSDSHLSNGFILSHVNGDLPSGDVPSIQGNNTPNGASEFHDGLMQDIEEMTIRQDEVPGGLIQVRQKDDIPGTTIKPSCWISAQEEDKFKAPPEASDLLRSINLDNNEACNLVRSCSIQEKEAENVFRSNNLKYKLAMRDRLVPTRSKEEVPVLFREPHVEKGFRALHQPWSYYLLSIFQLHNESMNVWTHLLAGSLIACKIVTIASKLDFVHDPYTWPLLAGTLCGVLLYMASSGAHCLQSKSELIHYTAFMVDYAGIGLYGLGSVILHLAYCSENEFYYAVKDVFVPLGGVLAFLICYCCSIAKVIYQRPYPFTRKLWQMTPVIGIYIVLISPVIHRLIVSYYRDGVWCESAPCHFKQIGWFILSGLFFASDFPQRLRPGMCDHFFHSHQLFHISIMMCTLQQIDGVFIDFHVRQDIIRQRPIPTFVSAFGPVIVVLLLEIACIFSFWKRIKAKLSKKS